MLLKIPHIHFEFHKAFGDHIRDAHLSPREVPTTLWVGLDSLAPALSASQVSGAGLKQTERSEHHLSLLGRAARSSLPGRSDLRDRWLWPAWRARGSYSDSKTRVRDGAKIQVGQYHTLDPVQRRLLGNFYAMILSTCQSGVTAY